jgi:hypothetical protein
VVSIAVIAFIGFSLHSQPQSSSAASIKFLEVYIGDQLEKRIEIPDDNYTQTFSIVTEHGMNTVRIKDGAVSMVEADCPDHLCEHSQPIHRLNDLIVCMPNRVILTLVSE